MPRQFIGEKWMYLNKDLTTGKPEKVLWQFCLPLFGSILFQQLYNIADSFVAGKFVGEEALAAVGNSYEITLIFIAVAFGCNIGCSVTVSQLFGGKRYGELKTAVTTTFVSGGLLCAVLMVLGTGFSRQLLQLIRTPEEVLLPSQLYLNIYIWGLPFVFFYNIATGVFSALGDSKTPFIFLMCSSLANIGMDILFTTVLAGSFSHGVEGVAWATFLCQGVSSVLAVAVVLKRLHALVPERTPLFSGALLRQIAGIAVPSMLQQSFISVGNIILQGVINAFGTGVMAGYSASVKLNNLVITSFTTIGNGISNYAAQNIGAGKYSRIREGFQAGIRMVWIVCLPLAVLYFFGGDMLVRVFLTDPSPEARATGITYLKILSPFYFVISAKLVADGILRGAGKMKQFMAATFTDLILRVVLALILSETSFGSTGIWMAWPVGWTVAAALSLFFYRREMGKT